jgi:hypothetical protein
MSRVTHFEAGGFHRVVGGVETSDSFVATCQQNGTMESMRCATRNRQEGGAQCIENIPLAGQPYRRSRPPSMGSGEHPSLLDAPTCWRGRAAATEEVTVRAGRSLLSCGKPDETAASRRIRTRIWALRHRMFVPGCFPCSIILMIYEQIPQVAGIVATT